MRDSTTKNKEIEQKAIKQKRRVNWYLKSSISKDVIKVPNLIFVKTRYSILSLSFDIVYVVAVIEEVKFVTSAKPAAAFPVGQID